MDSNLTVYNTNVNKNKSRQLSTTIFQCSQVVAYNNDLVSLKWRLELLDGTIIYESNTIFEWQYVRVDLSLLNLAPSTYCRLKVIVKSMPDYYADEIFEYMPASNTAYYEYSPNEPVKFNGLVPSPLSPPVLNFSSLSLYNHVSLCKCKFELRLLDTDYLVYSSNTISYNHTLNISFLALDIPLNTKLSLRANVNNGKDCTAYMALNYDPTTPSNIDSAKFLLNGNAFYTVLIYKGNE